DDVDDRVERSDLVELDPLRGDTVHAPLRLGEPGEDGERIRTDGFGKGASLQQPADVRPGAVSVVVRVGTVLRMLAVHTDVELRRRDSRARDLLGRGLDRAETERRDRVTERGERQPEVDEGADGHVAADPGERVEVSDSHRSDFRLRGLAPDATAI